MLLLTGEQGSIQELNDAYAPTKILLTMALVLPTVTF